MLIRSSLFALALSVVALGCGSYVDDPHGSSSSQATGNDPCADRGAYGDGQCDDACPEPDPDCTPAECPDPSSTEVHYLAGSDANPEICTRIAFACGDGQTLFSSLCGCGCVDDPAPPPVCPDPADPRVHYMGDSRDDPSACLAMMFACSDAQTAFIDECGCGCVDNLDNPPGPDGDFCGGIGGIACPSGFECVLDGDYPDAGGHCEATAEGQFCGGIGAIACPSGFECVLDGDYPDAGGHCEATAEGQFCGGIGGIACPSGFECVLDGDYPDAGGACHGI